MIKRCSRKKERSDKWFYYTMINQCEKEIEFGAEQQQKKPCHFHLGVDSG